jgi:hypothetical protein
MVQADARRPTLLVLPALHTKSLHLPAHTCLLVAPPHRALRTRKAMVHYRQGRRPRHQARHGYRLQARGRRLMTCAAWPVTNRASMTHAVADTRLTGSRTMPRGRQPGVPVPRPRWPQRLADSHKLTSSPRSAQVPTRARCARLGVAPPARPPHPHKGLEDTYERALGAAPPHRMAHQAGRYRYWQGAGEAR